MGDDDGDDEDDTEDEGALSVSRAPTLSRAPTFEPASRPRQVPQKPAADALPAAAAASPSRTLSRAAARKASETTREVTHFYRTVAKTDMDRGPVWSFKVFFLFPLLLKLRFLDHYFRVLFPLAYISYVLFALGEVGFGTQQDDLLRKAACYPKV